MENSNITGSPQPPNPETKVPTTNSYKSTHPLLKILLYTLLALVLCSSGFVVGYYLGRNNKSYSTTTDSLDNKDDSVNVVYYDLPINLYDKSFNSNGIASGYIKVSDNSSSSNNFLFPKVKAESDNREPVVFFRNSDENGNTQIFMMYVNTKQIKQITEGNLSSQNPVYSSVSQRLAYTKGDCALNIIDLTTNETIEVDVVQEEKSGKMAEYCNTQPLAWSPDGSKLAILSRISVISELGLVSYGRLHVFDQNSNSTKYYNPPAGLDSTYGDMFWTSNTNLLVRYHRVGNFAEMLDQTIYDVEFETGDMITTNLDTNLRLDSIQVSSNQLIAVGGDDSQLFTITYDQDWKTEQISNFTNASFLLLTEDTTGEPIRMLVFMGNPGTIGGIKLSDHNFLDGLTTPLSGYAEDSYSSYPLGWGKDYSEFVYIATLSGYSELRLYNLDKQSSTTLIPSLLFQ